MFDPAVNTAALVHVQLDRPIVHPADGGWATADDTKMDSLEMSVSSNVSVSFLSRCCPLWRLAGLGYFQIVSQCTLISH